MRRKSQKERHHFSIHIVGMHACISLLHLYFPFPSLSRLLSLSPHTRPSPSRTAMEFPTVGAHCAQPSCQSLSFLPHQCSFCRSSFCSTHRLPTDHECGPWSALSHAASVQVCSACEQMLWTPKGKDPQRIVKDTFILFWQKKKE